MEQNDQQVQRAFTYEAIPLEQLTATDLKEETQRIPDAEAYRVTLVKPTGYQDTNSEHPQVLYSPSQGRMGIAWGANATWADVDSVEEGIDLYLNDAETWNARN